MFRATLVLLLFAPSLTAAPKSKNVVVTGAICGTAYVADRGATGVLGPMTETLELVRQSDNAFVEMAPTEANGDFKFAAVPPGRYRIRMEQATFIVTIDTVEVRKPTDDCQRPVF